MDELLARLQRAVTGRYRIEQELCRGLGILAIVIAATPVVLLARFADLRQPA